MVGFERHIGAAADVKELEYISALHQTDLNGVRTDGSIRAEDISLFMLSRFGIVVTEDEVRETIQDGFGGGSSENECIDLMEVVAILLVPLILKASKVEIHQEDLSDKYEQPNEHILQKTLSMILEDVTGDSEPKPLDKELLKRIFVGYGEKELAEDSVLHEQMLEAAYNGKGGDVKLDLESFAAGLTFDLQEYDIRNELRSTTHYDDIMLTKGGREITRETVLAEQSRELSVEDLESKKNKRTLLLKRFTAPAIDATAGNYRSKYLIIFLWVTGIISYFAYWFDPSFLSSPDACPDYEYSTSNPWILNADTIACETAFSVTKWLGRFLLFSLFGLFFVGFGSFGNGVENNNRWSPLLGLLVVFLFAACPFYINSASGGQRFLNFIALCFGLVVCFFHACNYLALTISRETRKKYPFLKSLLWTSSLKDLKELKHAGQEKICLMTSNALKIHEDYQGGVLGTHFGRGLYNFALKGHETEQIGGFSWTWQRIFDRSIFSEHGLWYSNRLISSNASQFILAIYVLLFGIELTRRTLENFDSEGAQTAISDASGKFLNTAVDEVLVDSLLANFTGALGKYVDGGEVIDCPSISPSGFGESSEYFCSFAESAVGSNGSDLEKQLELLSRAGFDSRGLEAAARIALAEAAEASVVSLYPTEEYMIFWPMVIGTAASFLTAVYLACIFLPSITSKILRLRCGMIPTLHDRHFNKYRFAGDQVSILTGSMFWGSLIASALVGGIVGFIVFLFLWQAAIYFVQRAVAFLVGVIAVALLRICILLVCRCAMYSAFYRRRPMPANITLLGLEWANFTLSVAFVLVRVVKLIIAAGFYIGRIDTPFLAPGVGKIKNFELDNYPTVYLKDLLSHEAHRHPYIETLGTMYLMKLRYPQHFGQRAGSAWRLLFVYSLMPWMHKYRIHVGQQQEQQPPPVPLLLQRAGNDADSLMASLFTRQNFDRLAGQMRNVLRVRKRNDGDPKAEETTSFEGVELSTIIAVPMDDEEGNDGAQELCLAKQKSAKLEIENEALRNRISQLESLMDAAAIATDTETDAPVASEIDE